jgi:antitoxin component YwqK of YwqJK toxin-antitoxin module
VIQYIDTYKNGQRINRKFYDEIGKLIPDPAILN